VPGVEREHVCHDSSPGDTISTTNAAVSSTRRRRALGTGRRRGARATARGSRAGHHPIPRRGGRRPPCGGVRGAPRVRLTAYASTRPPSNS
jgi:hypothetical protein